jgi:predicted secreted protein
MSYVNSQAFAGRGSIIQFSVNPPSIPYVVIAEIKSIAFSGAKADLADVTNMQSGIFREYLPTLNDSGELTFSGNLIPNDPTEADLLGFFNNQTLATYQIVLPPDANQGYSVSLGTFTFKAYVSSFDRSLPIDKEATVSGKLKITGTVTYTTGS